VAHLRPDQAVELFIEIGDGMADKRQSRQQGDGEDQDKAGDAAFRQSGLPV